MATKKVSARTPAQKIKIKEFDIGVKLDDRTVVFIPGRGRVSVASPRGDMYFDGSYTKDTGPTHIQNLKAGDLYFKGSYTKDTGPSYVKNGTTSDLHFRGSHTEDTGPTHVQQVGDLIDKATYQKSGPIPPYEFSIKGVLSKKDYLYLVRRGCTLKNGVIAVPAEKVDEVRKYLKLGE